ncbi:Hypothetical protein SMAX5B_014575 [Scophthalmus maximus]|uniref:Uncharacterized protein n=1 Tax=Scophthalmus maximus TaxID=52904 RepID=A0A2U9C0U3_SCOMX|nr:Hypothetical protein SMAX5B_014575 [Scophthalmus maximus]
MEPTVPGGTKKMTYAEMFARVRDWCERSTVESKRIRPTDRQKRPYCEVSQDGTSTLVRPPQRMKMTTGADTVCENQIKRATRTVRAPPHETKVWSCWPESSSVESGRFTLCTEPKRPNVEASQGAPSIPERPSQGGKMTIDAEEKGPENGKSSQRSPVTPPSTSAEDPSPVTQVQSQRTEEMASSCRKGKKNVQTIWIIGSSYIRRGEEAANEIFGENLGLNAKVEWFSKGSLRWSGVLPLFYGALSTRSPPDILVVHAGGNDLGLVQAETLAAEMNRDLVQLHRDFPSMRISFSSINERQVWRYGQPGQINTDRLTVTYLITKAVDHFGGEVIQHPHLRYFDRSTYLQDGVQYSKKGNTIFLSKIRVHLQRILQISALYLAPKFVACPNPHHNPLTLTP